MITGRFYRSTRMQPVNQGAIGCKVLITRWLEGRPIDAHLASELRAAFPPEGEEFRALAVAAAAEVDSGRIGRRIDETTIYARLHQPTPQSCGFSVDIVKLTNVKGALHRHPRGEIDMIVPLDPSARFAGHGRGWLTFGPGSIHRPVVTGGSAIVVYLLPGGEMTFG